MLREKIVINTGSLFNVRMFRKKYFEMPMHNHSEYELVYIIHGSGQKYIGNTITPFCDGDLSMVGPDVPHTFIAEEKYHQDNDLYCEWYVIQFREGIFPRDYKDLVIFGPISRLLQESAYGITFFSRGVKKQFCRFYKLIENANSFNKLSYFYEVMTMLANDSSQRRICELNSQNDVDFDDPIIENIYNYLIHNYRRKLSLDDIAEAVSLQKTTMCTYYKKHTLRTVHETLTDIRVKRACILLSQSKLPVYQIAYETGFNNISNFNRRFMELKNVTPTSYRSLYENVMEE